MGDSPLASVIIPVCNGERYLGEAIESVLAQDYRPIELIVVDDGSCDTSARIALSFKEVRYFYQPNQGVAMARNAGIALSRGEFVSFLDQDDLWTPNKLNVQIHHLREHPHFEYVIARQRVFLERGTPLPAWMKKEFLERDLPGFLPGTLTARKTVFEKIGNFSSHHTTASDVEWFFRAKDAGIAMKALPEVLLYKRIHCDNQSYQIPALHLEYLKIARVSIGNQKNNGKRREG